MRVLIVEDEPMGRASLRALVEGQQDLELAGELENGDQADEWLNHHSVDLMLLDIHMPGMSGLDLLDKMRKQGRPVPAVIFTTAFDRYAIQAFDFEAVDYLLKPVDEDRFVQAIDRARQRLGASDSKSKWVKRLSIHREGRVEIIEVDRILWVEAADQYVRIHTESGPHLMRASMGRMEEVLNPNEFMRVHRSAIVALAAVRAMESRPGGTAQVLVDDQTWVPVSRSRASHLRKRLG
ncbi:MAG: DNA-binding response regulator [Planctomycetota bacterium]|nr:MAG: DNA-binding response regulator [Planctomycetota bacterium]